MIQEMLEQAKIIVCLGTGGVGKTTTAAAIGALASQMGKRVLIITIDPAQRLKQTLNLDSSQVTEIHHPSFKGKYYGTLIDPKEVFDGFLDRVSGAQEKVSGLKKNHLYQQMTTSLSGSQEFSSLEKLLSCFETGSYDLIVLDTPPSHHAIEFLQAPQKLATLFNENIAHWFRNSEKEKSGLLNQFLSSGTHQVIRALEKLTGSAFMSELGDFFKNIHLWQSKLEERIYQMHNLLAEKSTQYLVITTFEPDKVNESQKFAKEIQKGGYNLRGVIVNRAMPEGVNLERDVADKSPRADLFRKFQQQFRDRTENMNTLSKSNRIDNFMFLPDLQNDVKDIESVVKLSRYLKAKESTDAE